MQACTHRVQQTGTQTDRHIIHLFTHSLPAYLPHSLFLTVCLILSAPPSISLLISAFLSHYPCLSYSLACLSHSLSLSLPVSLPDYLAHSPWPSVYLTLCVSVSLPLSVLLSHLSVSVSAWLSHSLCPSVYLAHCLSVSLSLSVCLTLSACLTVSFSLSLCLTSLPTYVLLSLPVSCSLMLSVSFSLLLLSLLLPL